MRLAIAALLLLHGLLHLPGFLKPFGLARLSDLTGRALVPLSPTAGQVVGAAWLAAAFVLCTAAALRLAEARAWWKVAGVGVVLSQALVVLMWHDAWGGTVSNAVIACAVVIAAALAAFEGRMNREARELLSRVPPGAGAVLRAEELEPLPAPVRRWLEAAGVVGRRRARTGRLVQAGKLRLRRGGAWLEARAEQYFDLEHAAFTWIVKTELAGAVPVVGRDRCVEGRGNMLIKLLGLVTVANASGPRIDEGTLLRLLGELVWFPSAALAPWVSWEAIDESRARATLTAGGTSVSAELCFDASGRFEKLRAQRWYSPAGRDGSLEPWEVTARAWKRFDGIEIPSQGDVVWKLGDGDLDTYRWRIELLELDVPETFADRPSAAGRHVFGPLQGLRPSSARS